jgi:hypothetical protein
VEINIFMIFEMLFGYKTWSLSLMEGHREGDAEDNTGTKESGNIGRFVKITW